MRISDWSSDVCSSDLTAFLHLQVHLAEHLLVGLQPEIVDRDAALGVGHAAAEALLGLRRGGADGAGTGCGAPHAAAAGGEADRNERVALGKNGKANRHRALASRPREERKSVGKGKSE